MSGPFVVYGGGPFKKKPKTICSEKLKHNNLTQPNVHIQWDIIIIDKARGIAGNI